jgi:hypothetical protein
MNTTTDVSAYVQALWLRFIDLVPQLVGAIIVLAIGIAIAYIVAAIVRKGLQFTGIDNWVSRARLNERLSIDHQSSYALISNMVASIVRWVIIIGTLGVAADMLNLTGVQVFIGTILAYIPNVIVAVIILTIGIIAGQIVAELVGAGEGILSVSLRARKTVSLVAKYAIITFSIMAALIQLNIVPALIQILFGGIVLALALAFGLGGREHASQWISDMKRQA